MHLYVIKRRTTNGHDSTWVASFNVAKQVFDDSTVSLGDACPAPSLVVRSASRLEVSCGGHNIIYVVALSADGTMTGSSALQLPAPAGILPTGEKNAAGDVRVTGWGTGRAVFLF